ncbi:MAG: hypothetical protein AAFU85_09265 [Planctomycetota bacterium]
MLPRYFLVTCLLAAMILSGCSSELSAPAVKDVAKRTDSSTDELPPGVTIKKAENQTVLPDAPQSSVAKAASSARGQGAFAKALVSRWLAGGPLDPREVQKFLEATNDVRGLPTIAESQLKEDEDPWIADGPMYRILAEQAARSRRFRVSHDLFCASFLADELRGEESIRYSDLLGRPVWKLSFGVSLTVHGSSQFGPQPIRDTGRSKGARQTSTLASSDRLARGGSVDARRSSTAGSIEGAGSSRKSDPTPSTVAGEIESILSSDIDTTRPRVMAVGGEVNDRIDAHLGLVAKIVGETINDYSARGAFGTLSPGALHQRFANAESLAKESPIATLLKAIEPPAVWFHDIQLIERHGLPGEFDGTEGPVEDGSDRFTALLEGARRSDVDFLIHFDVYLKEIDGATRNVSRCRLFAVRNRRMIAESRGVSSVAAAKPNLFGRADPYTYTVSQLQPVLTSIGRDLPTRELPSLTPELAKRQIAALLAKHDADSISTLAIVDLYRKLNLIDERQADQACQIAGGERAMRLRRLPWQRQLVAEMMMRKAGDHDDWFR